MKPKECICLAVIALVFLFYALTIRAGQRWGDDFAMYIHEAKNLAQHAPLNNTGYIYNPYRPVVGPKLYPPVFPALLVPAYLIGGLNNLTPLKLEMVLFFIGLLIVLWRELGAELSPYQRAAMLAIIGFNPLFWDVKETVISDIPFAFVLYATLALAERLRAKSSSAPERPSAARSSEIWGLLALAGLAYLCYGTRTIGIVVIPTLALLGGLYWKRGGRLIAAAVGVSFLLCAAQMKLLGGDRSYFDQLKLPLLEFGRQVFTNVVGYSWSLATFWENPYWKAGRNAILLVASLLALVAYYRRLRNAPRSYELFLPLYLGIVLLWPNGEGFRYLIPIIPLYIFYFVEGAETFATWLRLSARRRAVLLAPLLVAILLSYTADFAHEDFGAFKEGIAKKESMELFSFIRSSTSADDIFIFGKPRAFSLYTERAASIYPGLQNQTEVCRYARSIGATYLIAAPAIDDPRFDDYLGKVPRKQLVFSNSDFRVFQVRPADLEECSSGPSVARSLAY